MLKFWTFKRDLNTENGFFKENNWAYGSRVTGTFAGVGGGGTAGMIAFGTVMGGAGAALTGGNFWNGAVTGLVVSGLNHAMHQGIDPPGKKSLDVRKNAVKPSFAKFAEVEGNTLGVVDLVHGSKTGNWLRGGTSGLKSVSNTLKGAGAVLGGVSVGLEAVDYINGDMSGLEFGVDTAITGAAVLTSFVAISIGGVALAPFVAGGALIYFGGKAIFEYSSGQTLFTKPTK